MGLSGLSTCFDQYFINRRHADALAVVDRLDKRVADPYLDFYRALVHLEKGDATTAKRLLDGVIAAEPTLPDPYKRRISLALADRDFPLLVRLMVAAEQRAGLAYNADKMKSIDVYAEFVKSPEYPRWVRQKQAAIPGAPAAGAATRPSQ